MGKKNKQSKAKPLTGLAAALLVSGCGFQPIHGERSIASGAALATIDIGLIADRMADHIRTELKAGPSHGT